MVNNKTMAHFIKDLGSSKDMISFGYSSISKEELVKQATTILTQRNYKKVSEANGNYTFESGNRTMRILLGAFIKYFKFHLQVHKVADGMLEIKIIRATSGMSGGVIGMNQVTKEMTEIAMALKKL